ncbi:hypothetical protein ES703_50907 [subsurface metagenome]
MIPKVKNSNKIILDLCGGSGAWSKPYKDAGYDVRLVTLPDRDVKDYIPPENVYGILAAPPCTMFSFARTRAKTPRNFYQAIDTVKACLNIIWRCRCAAPVEFWALENPEGYLRQFLGRPANRYKHCEFGHPSGKIVCLWGYFKPPIKHKRKKSFSRDKHGMSRWYNKHRSSAWRSITPAGFAQAFFQANP